MSGNGSAYGSMNDYIYYCRGGSGKSVGGGSGLGCGRGYASFTLDNV